MRRTGNFPCNGKQTTVASPTSKQDQHHLEFDLILHVIGATEDPKTNDEHPRRVPAAAAYFFFVFSPWFFPLRLCLEGRFCGAERGILQFLAYQI